MLGIPAMFQLVSAGWWLGIQTSSLEMAMESPRSVFLNCWEVCRWPGDHDIKLQHNYTIIITQEELHKQEHQNHCLKSSPNASHEKTAFPNTISIAFLDNLPAITNCHWVVFHSHRCQQKIMISLKSVFFSAQIFWFTQDSTTSWNLWSLFAAVA